MRARDETKLSVIRMVRAAVKNAEIAARGAPLDDAGVIGVIQKDVKEHRDSIAEFQKGNRQDLVAKSEAELAILVAYLPQQLSREEVAAAVREVIAQTGAQGLTDKGKVMPVVVEEEECDGTASGLSDNYIKVSFNADGLRRKSAVLVKINEITEGICKGTVVL